MIATPNFHFVKNLRLSERGICRSCEGQTMTRSICQVSTMCMIAQNCLRVLYSLTGDSLAGSVSILIFFLFMSFHVFFLFIFIFPRRCILFSFIARSRSPARLRSLHRPPATRRVPPSPTCCSGSSSTTCRSGRRPTRTRRQDTSAQGHAGR